MPSAESLVGRVAMVTALAAAAASLLAALAASYNAKRLVLAVEDQRLREANAVFIAELTPNASFDQLRREISEESHELLPASIRIAAHVDGAHVGGDPSVPDVAAGTCATFAATRLRACATGTGRYVIVSSAVHALSDDASFLLGAFVAAGLAAFAAAIAGKRSARWALEPLTKLRDSLQGIADFDPREARLAGDDRCEEVASLRAALASLLERLAASLDVARRFSADAAHEIRTPLAAIVAELDLLAEEALPPDSQLAVTKLRARGAALGRLVERLLALATARTLTMEPVALEDVAREVIELTKGADARLLTDVQGMVHGDATLLAALLENVLENAFKFGARAVEVRITETPGAVLLDISDDGPGLAADARSRVFEPFFRTPEARGSGTSGHGLGLALVAQIAAAHEARAEFVDEPRGAHLRVAFPAWRPRA